MDAMNSILLKANDLKPGLKVYAPRFENLSASRPMFYEPSEKPLVLVLKTASFNQTTDWFVRMAISVIEKHIANCKFTVEILAQDLRISRRQLFRKFKAFIDCTPKTFVRDMRLKRAAQLLRDSQMTILEITYAVGFCDPNNFRTVFRKKFGMLPSIYAKQFDYTLVCKI
jgi:transcriptional regulator GlxA family with amidase domain